MGIGVRWDMDKKKISTSQGASGKSGSADWVVANALPTGTVTFLFTDIQCSSPLWESHPDLMEEARAQAGVPKEATT